LFLLPCQNGTRLHRISKLSRFLGSYCLHCIVYIFDNRQAQFVTFIQSDYFPSDFERDIYILVEVLVCIFGIINQVKHSSERNYVSSWHISTFI
jgi:hypothetical protein